MSSLSCIPNDREAVGGAKTAGYAHLRRHFFMERRLLMSAREVHVSIGAVAGGELELL